MRSQDTASHTQVRLPATLGIGFSGHRALTNEEKCRTLIFDFLKQRKESTPGTVYGVSSSAAGGDLLFCESCIQLDIPLSVLLPLPEREFRADFDDASWRRVEQVLKRAASVEVTSGSESREECYYECGIETVRRSRLLVALWNGEPSQGLGGTEDIVSFATETGKPVIWLHSVTGETRILNEQQEQNLLRDPELEFLNGQPDPGTYADTSTPSSLARAWFRKMDENASRHAPHFRRMAAIPIVCAAAAAVCSGAGAWARNTSMWLAIGTALGIMAAALPIALRLKKRQVLWTRTRTAAEICRSFLALWSTPLPYAAIGPEAIPELSGMLESLNLLKMLDRSRGEMSLDEFKRRYREERVSHQAAYFSNQAVQSAAMARTYKTVMWVCIGLATFANAWLFAGSHGLATFSPGSWKHPLALASSIAFQIAAVGAALLVVNDCERRKQRYLELRHVLEDSDAQIERLRTWPTVLRVVDGIEKALLTEIIEWRSMIRNRGVPKK